MRLMKIGIDARCLLEGRRTGVEEYVLNLLPRIFEINKKDEFVLFLNSFKKTTPDLDWIRKHKNVRIKKFSLPNKLLNFFFWYFGWPKIDILLGGVDVMFFPNLAFGAVSRKADVILTVHDLSFERYPEFFSWKRRLWHIFLNPRKFICRSDRIISVSHSTKDDLKRLYGISEKKVKVVASGISEKFSPSDGNNPELLRVKEKYSLPWKFVLHLGTSEPRKNVGSLIRAFGAMKREAEKIGNSELARYKLVLAGSPGWLEKDTLQEVERNGLKDDVVMANFIEEADKPLLYNLAGCLVFPSYLEGFGFPPLEAQRSGTPVIVSNNSAFPETVGRSAVMIDPERPTEIREALEALLGDRELREKLAGRGWENAKEFSWKKTAEKTGEILEEIREARKKKNNS